MVRIIPEIIENAIQFTNAINDRELDLRGYKFPAIENLGSTLDQYDTIDFTDNEIRKLDGFPLLKRLKNLMVVNNKVARIADDFGYQLPNLLSLILSGNGLSDLRDLDPLSTCTKLDFLSLLHSPVTMRANYRLYVISTISSLHYLDYRRVTQTERKLACSMFKRLPALSVNSGNLKASLKLTLTNNINNGFTSLSNSIPTSVVDKTFVLGDPVISTNTQMVLPPGTEPVHVGDSNGDGKESVVNPNQSESSSSEVTMPPPANPMTTTGNKRPLGGKTQDLFAIQEAIKRARTMDEVERLHQLLSSGQISGFAVQWQKQLRQQQRQNSNPVTHFRIINFLFYSLL